MDFTLYWKSCGEFLVFSEAQLGSAVSIEIIEGYGVAKSKLGPSSDRKCVVEVVIKFLLHKGTTDTPNHCPSIIKIII